MGQRMFEATLAAADRGVRVRLLLDDIGTKFDNDLLALDSHPGSRFACSTPSPRAAIAAGRAGRVQSREPAHAQQGLHRRQPSARFWVDAMSATNTSTRTRPGTSRISTSWRPGRRRRRLGRVRPVLERADVVSRRGARPAGVARPRSRGAARPTRRPVESQRDSADSEIAKARAADLLSVDSDGEFWGGARLVFDDPSRSPGIAAMRGSPDAAARTLDRGAEEHADDRVPLFHPWRRRRRLADRTGQARRRRHRSDQLARVDRRQCGPRRLSALPRSAARDGVRLFELRPDAFEVPADTRDTDHLRAPRRRCTPRPSSSTAAPSSSARSTSIRGRSSSTPRSASCARAPR